MVGICSVLDAGLAGVYTSPSQRIRVLTEDWAHRHIYCPGCGAEPLRKHANNRPVSDFSCPVCGEVYELKSKKGPFGRKVTDGAYRTMMERLTGNDVPNLILLSYVRNPPAVEKLILVPRHFLVPSLIEKRRPLSQSARRAGWVGCNILLDDIPRMGRILLFAAGEFLPKADVNARWQETMFLRHKPEASWLIHVLKGIESLGRPTFSLAEIYCLEGRLQRIYPGNHHIRPKIRQQLQRLRDSGHIEFLGRGEYRVRGLDRGR